MVKSGSLTLPDEDLSADMYDYAYSKLLSNNILRYEVSNFAKEGYKCKHNLNYWQRGEYLGFGVAAHSFLGDERFFNCDNIEDYINNINSGVVTKTEKISEKDAEFEYIMLGLRLSEGINLSSFNKLYNSDFLTKYAKALKKAGNLIVYNNNNVKVADKGFNVLNTILTEFLPD